MANPWMIGHEREVNEMREEIERLIRERNNMHERINARRRLRVRRGEGELARLGRGERAIGACVAEYENVRLHVILIGWARCIRF